MCAQEKNSAALACVECTRAILDTLREELASGEKGPGKAGFLNSPFIITFLGGLFVTAITLLVQHLAAGHDRQLQYSIKRFDRMAAVMVKMAEEFPEAIYLVYAMEKRSCWLADPRNKDKDYDDGRDHGQTRAFYDSLVEKFFSATNPSSLLAEAPLFFTSESVLLSTRTLESQVGQMFEALKPSEVTDSYRQASQELDVLLGAMARELRGLEPFQERGSS
jgi:hypothetical protein